MHLPLFLAIAYEMFKRKNPTRFPEPSEGSSVILSVNQVSWLKAA
jgi:hypothetical protein